VVTFEENRTICPEVAVHEQFLPGKLKFLKKLAEKSKFFKNLPGKSKFFV